MGCDLRLGGAQVWRGWGSDKMACSAGCEGTAGGRGRMCFSPPRRAPNALTLIPELPIDRFGTWWGYVPDVVSIGSERSGDRFGT